MARGERNIPWGFGVAEGAKGQAIIVNIVGGSLAERAGLRNGDEIEGVEGLNNLDINAVDRLLVTSRDRIELIIHRHSNTSASVNQTSQQQQQQTRIWRPDVQESGDSHRPFKVSLEHSNDSKPPAGFNSSALPFQADPRVKHLQYNSPMGLYSNDNVAESYNQQTTGYVETPRLVFYSLSELSCNICFSNFCFI
ncbi:unnamed protein product [Auanema sp. JU1783]|nr:unnamed protein product [Auanema sp. JU1783]